MSEDGKKKAEDAKSGGPGSFKILLIVLLGALIAGASGGATVAVLSPAPVVPPPGPGAGGEGHGDGEAGDGQTGEDALEELPDGTPTAVLNLEPFVVNLADKDYRRYLKVSVKVAFRNETKLAHVRDNPAALAKVRDNVIVVLSAKRSTDLNTPDGKHALRDEVKEAIIEAVDHGRHAVRAVYFSDFVTQ